jgi:hypothetical protein
MYLQVNKPLFPLPLVHIIPPEELSAAAAEARGGAGSPHKKEEKKEVTEAPGSPLSVFSPSFP